jgi:hypothetical protein
MNWVGELYILIERYFQQLCTGIVIVLGFTVTSWWPILQGRGVSWGSIRTKRVRKQQTNRRDAQLILRLLVEDRFPRSGAELGEPRSAATAVASASHDAGVA